MLVLLADAVHCFQDNAVLQGNSQSKVLTLVLTPAPENDPLCVASNNRESLCKLQYLDAAGAVQTIDQSFIYIDSAAVAIRFNLSSAAAKYTLISAQSLLSYIALIVGSLESPGAVQTIQHTQMNATNCWDDLVLRYNRSAGHEFLQMDGTPLDCQITAPVVKFEYFAEERWRSFGVQGVSGEAGYYDATKTFNHSETLHYKQTLAGLTDAAAIEVFKYFFVAFQNNRSIETRIHIVTTIGSLDQIILAAPLLVLSMGSPCYSALQPLGYASVLQVTAFSHNVEFLDHTACSSKTTSFGNQMRIITDTFNFSSSREINSLPHFRKRSGFSITFDAPIANYSQLTSGVMISYLTYYDENDVILDEESVLLALALSCFQNIQAFFQRDRLCVQVQTFPTAQCIARGSSQLQYVLGIQPGTFLTRQVVFVFSINYVYNGSLQCTSTYGTNDYAENLAGTVAVKTALYQKMVANHTTLYNFLQSTHEYIRPTVLLLSDMSPIYTYFGIIISGVLLLTAVGVGVLVHMQRRG
ncbi:hypothetical protein SS50377_24155 [Spironucleus salmonicida]|nr:hypothetical protein SS50377_24152 [Spironucleus salmonicida]KAH0574208.1 hypothetical protein SS50377_24155 [Spironucleus salmonicida]